MFLLYTFTKEIAKVKYRTFLSNDDIKSFYDKNNTWDVEHRFYYRMVIFLFLTVILFNPRP